MLIIFYGICAIVTGYLSFVKIERKTFMYIFKNVARISPELKYQR